MLLWCSGTSTATPLTSLSPRSQSTRSSITSSWRYEEKRREEKERGGKERRGEEGKKRWSRGKGEGRGRVGGEERYFD